MRRYPASRSNGPRALGVSGIVNLYKFCRREHLDAFFSDGQIHLGTPRSYRAEEGGGSMVADPFEGVKRIRGEIPDLTAETIKKYPALSGIMAVRGGGRVHIRLENIDVSYEDVYIFSCSSEYSKEVHQQWRLSEEYDACYRIRLPADFFRAISEVVADKATFLGYRCVVYYDSDTGLDVHSPLAGIHPACLKGGKNFGPQTEVRAFWKPRAHGDVKPFVLYAPEAIQYCEHHAVLS